MKGNGNGFGTLFRKLYFMLIPTCGMRTRYIIKHRSLFRHVGKDLFFQPRKFPSDPEMIWLGDNVKVASDVVFINHDVVPAMLTCKFKPLRFNKMGG